MMQRPMREGLDRAAGRISLHMPGHKGRAPFEDNAWFPLDQTELAVTDDLYAPESMIAAAETLYARAAGSGRALLLHNGSTAGIQAMLMLWAREGDTVILPRNAHLSAVNGCVVGGMRVKWIRQRFTAEGYGFIREDDVLAALAACPEARTLLLTRPDFYGGCIPLERIVRAAHGQGCRVVIDEAHGAHFPWLDGSGIVSAGALGTDAWVQSCHKTLPSLTGTAVLHVRDAAKGARALSLTRLTQTSSPSFLFLMSMDDARAYMEEKGAAALADLAARVTALKRSLPQWGYGDAQAQAAETGYAFDPTRFVIDAPQGGEALDAALRARGIDAEMHDVRRVVCILSVMDGAETTDALARALADIPPKTVPLTLPPYDQPLPQAVMTPRQAVMGRTEQVAIGQAAGRIAAGVAGLYPPGIPLVVPGERITGEIAAILAKAGSQARFGLTGDAIPCTADN